MRRILLVVFAALFFFSISFAVTYWGIRPVEPVPTELVGEKEHSEVEEQPVTEPQSDVSPANTGESDGAEEVEEEGDIPTASPRVEERDQQPEVILDDAEDDQHPSESLNEKAAEHWEQQVRSEEQYVGIHDEYVAVFQGQLGEGRLVMETDIPISTLPQFEIDNLREGITFDSEDEKYGILEGLHFPR